MKNLLIVALLVGASYAIYEWLSTYATKPVLDATSGQLERGKEVAEKASRIVREESARAVQVVVDKYKAEQGTYPASLQQLMELNQLSEIPPGLTYDPATGKVTAD